MIRLKQSRIALGFHTERLHDDQVWSRVEKVARWLAQHGKQATFFCYPFRAQVARKEIKERVRMLASLGHEISQHTHFYAGRKIEGPKKVNDFSPANIVYSLQRDFETLCAWGFTPKGFTAGAWMVNEVVWDTLIDLGFVYDCSLRFPKPGNPAISLYHRWAREPQVYSNEKGNLTLLPTTCSLGE